MPGSVVPPEPAVALPLVLDGVSVVHRRAGETPFQALAIERLVLDPGSRHGFAGPSGAGKSTLLHLVAGLVAPTAGSIAWGETRLERMSEPARDRWRRETIGFVFQDFHLIDELSTLHNVLLPARFSGLRLADDVTARAGALIERVGLTDPRRRAGLLSRGERQRVAVARALLAAPRLILADEPTASLDAETAAGVAALLVEVAAEAGATLMVAAHDPALLARLDTVHRLAAGRLTTEGPR